MYRSREPLPTDYTDTAAHCTDMSRPTQHARIIGRQYTDVMIFSSCREMAAPWNATSQTYFFAVSWHTNRSRGTTAPITRFHTIHKSWILRFKPKETYRLGIQQTWMRKYYSNWNSAGQMFLSVPRMQVCIQLKILLVQLAGAAVTASRNCRPNDYAKWQKGQPIWKYGILGP